MARQNDRLASLSGHRWRLRVISSQAPTAAKTVQLSAMKQVVAHDLPDAAPDGSEVLQPFLPEKPAAIGRVVIASPAVDQGVMLGNGDQWRDGWFHGTQAQRRSSRLVAGAVEYPTAGHAGRAHQPWCDCDEPAIHWSRSGRPAPNIVFVFPAARDLRRHQWISPTCRWYTQTGSDAMPGARPSCPQAGNFMPAKVSIIGQACAGPVCRQRCSRSDSAPRIRCRPASLSSIWPSRASATA